jgi:hypothetical protein
MYCNFMKFHVSMVGLGSSPTNVWGPGLLNGLNFKAESKSRGKRSEKSVQPVGHPRIGGGKSTANLETGKTHKASAILPFECHLLSLTYWLLIGVHPFLDQPNGKRTFSCVNCTSQTQANDSGLCRLGWWDFAWLCRTCQRRETGKLRLA